MIYKRSYPSTTKKNPLVYKSRSSETDRLEKSIKESKISSRIPLKGRKTKMEKKISQ